jgi:flagellar hook assembly protein FlgD
LITAGEIHYKIFVANNLTQSDSSNEATVTVVSINEEEQIPTEYKLSQNFPNPFNPSTTIEFALPFPSEVRLVIYNTLGESIITLLENYFPSGYHKVDWNSRDQFGNMLSSGIYFYELRAKGNNGDNFSQFRKMILIK